MNTIINNILSGLWLGLKLFTSLYFCYLGMRYIGERADADDIKKLNWYLLFVPVFVMFYELYKSFDRCKSLDTVTIITFVVFSVAGLITLFTIAMHDYNRRTNK